MKIKKKPILMNMLFGKGPDRLQKLADAWTLEMWEKNLWMGNKWMGVEILQWPTDLLIMQELIVEQKPKIILETGTHRGGSAIFYSSILKLIGGGRVVSVDIDHNDEVKKTVATHPFGSMVTLITGDSKAPETIDRVRRELGGEKSVLVTLDSNHTYEHVLGELDAYREFVPVGGYMVAMDTVCEKLGEIPGFQPWRKDNPARSAREFVAANPDFEVDLSRDKLLVGFSPRGFLKRTK